MSTSAEEYPNQWLGVDNATSSTAGAINRVNAPLKLDTASLIANSNLTTGACLQSGTGVPTVGSPVGGFYFRTDTPSTSNQRIYICTVAGAAGAATWVGIV